MLLQAPSSPRALKELMYENLNFSLTTLATRVGLNPHTPRAGCALLSAAERLGAPCGYLKDLDHTLRFFHSLSFYIYYATTQLRSYIATAVAGVHFFGAKKQNQKNIPLS
jgi:hypothetical protein